MILGQLLGSGNVAEVFAAGDDVLKLYRRGIDAGPARREYANLKVLETLPIAVPRALDVAEVEGRWGLLMSRAPGAPLAGQLAAGAGVDAVSDRVAGLHRSIHALPGEGLVPLKARLQWQIGQAQVLPLATREALTARLAALPDGDRVCHGDFHPFNVMADDAELTVVDWLDASCGAPAADVARSWLLARHNLPGAEEPYLTAYLAGSSLTREAVMAWVPVMAGARLSEGVAEEEARLLALTGTDAG